MRKYLNKPYIKNTIEFLTYILIVCLSLLLLYVLGIIYTYFYPDLINKDAPINTNWFVLIIAKTFIGFIGTLFFVGPGILIIFLAISATLMCLYNSIVYIFNIIREIKEVNMEEVLIESQKKNDN